MGAEASPSPRPSTPRGRGSLSRAGLIVIFALIFLGSIVAGLISERLAPRGEDESENQGQYAQIEKVFGPYRAAVREGQAGAMAVCMAMVFGFNLLGSVLRSLGSILIFPAFLSLVPTGVEIGRTLLSLHGSSVVSVAAFLVMVGLEWCSYVMSAAAGVNIGLAVVLPGLKSGSNSRRQAFRQAFRESLKLYLIIGLILCVQAIAEIFYVRAVLLHGGTGVPLRPY